MISNKIPDEIISKITDIEAERGEYEINRTRWYSYYETTDGELSVASVVVKESRKSSRELPTVYLKKVTVVTLSGKTYMRDVFCNYYGGYQVLWGDETYKSQNPGGMVVNDYETANWVKQHGNFHCYESDVLNPEFLNGTEFRYCAYDGTVDLFEYLRAYKSNPKIELLAKVCTCRYALKKNLVKALEKDKGLAHFLITNHPIWALRDFSVGVIKNAYRHKTTLDYENRLEQTKKRFRYGSMTEKRILMLFKNLSEKAERQLLNYIADVGTENYIDYMRAVIGLNLDLTETRNYMPHDFMHWHDVRIDEYNSKLAKLDEEKRAELYKAFSEVSAAYKPLEYCGKNYSVFIAKSPSELVREGGLLHHCVGRMGYDQKMSKGKTLIFFIRYAEKPTIPFVTAEIRPKDGKLLQCYGDHDNRPDDKVMSFVNEEWLPRIEKIISRGAIKYDCAM
jgi:hypothetical protein